MSRFRVVAFMAASPSVHACKSPSVSARKAVSASGVAGMAGCLPRAS